MSSAPATPVVTAIERLPPAWPPGAPSLLGRIEAAAAQDAHGRGLELDAHNPTESETVRWVAGLRDALFGRPDASERQVSARSLLAALGRLVRKPTAASFRHLHEALAAADVLAVIDGLLERALEEKLDHDAVAAVARRIASQSPDLGAVKFAIGLLGTSSDGRDRDLVLSLGRYEELTLFCAVALRNMLEDPEPAVWALAKAVHGWGRIQAIQRLADTENPAIRRWLVTEGYRNDIMIEEIACTCAVAGRLHELLRLDDPGGDVLDGAGELIEALIRGGPAEDIDDYEHAGEAVGLYLDHVQRGPAADLRRFLAVHAIRQFESADSERWAARAARGFTAVRRFDIRTKAAAFLARPEWRPLAEAILVAEASRDFWLGAEAGRVLGLDVWPYYFRRQEQGESPHGEWYWLMQTDRAERVEQVVALAERQLDLARIGSGRETGLGIGTAYADDSALDFILQDLGRFPGIGWPLVELGLRARTIRARNMAHRTLARWGEANWPAGARPLLEAALRAEPDACVAGRIRALLDGKSPL